MTSPNPPDQKFTLEIRKPFSTFTEGQPTPIPYIIDGLLPDAAFSVLGAKPKHGKSSMSRIEAVSIAKGAPFLDRPTTQGEVILCSLEDPAQHVDNCLKILDYDPAKDAEIHLVSKLPRRVEETVEILAKTLAAMPHVKFIILDTLAKVIRAKDSGSYDEMLVLCEQLHLLARETGVHIQALTHCKKVQPDDPFDGFLGSVEVRGEPDTNIVLFDSRGKRLLQSETRIGTAWEATEICAEMATIGKAQMVKRFYFGDTLAKSVHEQSVAHDANIKTTVKFRIVSALKAHGGGWEMSECLDSIVGAKAMKYDCRDELIRDKTIRMAGVAHSKTNPLKLILLKPECTSSSITSQVTSSMESPQLPVISWNQLPVCKGCNINKVAGEAFNAEWGVDFCDEKCRERSASCVN
jgi:AAA domain-containing protein